MFNRKPRGKNVGMVQNASEKPFLRNFISTVEGKTNRYLKKKVYTNRRKLYKEFLVDFFYYFIEFCFCFFVQNLPTMPNLIRTNMTYYDILILFNKRLCLI